MFFSVKLNDQSQCLFSRNFMTVTDEKSESDKHKEPEEFGGGKSADVSVFGCSLKQESSTVQRLRGCLAATQLLSVHH